jgi:hypothetical protein
VNETKASIKFQLKKVLCMGVAVANIDMEEAQIRTNIMYAINFLVSLLKKNWQVRREGGGKHTPTGSDGWCGEGHSCGCLRSWLSWQQHELVCMLLCAVCCIGDLHQR